MPSSLFLEPETRWFFALATRLVSSTKSNCWRSLNLLAIVVLMILLTGSLSAQDRIVNGQFDQDLTAWEIFPDASNLSALWATSDVAGSPTSGSAELRDQNPGDNGAQIVLRQCFVVTGAVSPLPWRVSAQVELEGEPWLRTFVAFSEHPNTTCSGGTLGPGLTREVNFSDPTWQTISGDYIIQAGSANSMRVSLLIEKPSGSGTGGLARFDNIVFGAVDDALFSDRFQGPP